jgi:hypothetical protein
VEATRGEGGSSSSGLGSLHPWLLPVCERRCHVSAGFVGDSPPALPSLPLGSRLLRSPPPFETPFLRFEQFELFESWWAHVGASAVWLRDRCESPSYPSLHINQKPHHHSRVSGSGSVCLGKKITTLGQEHGFEDVKPGYINIYSSRFEHVKLMKPTQQSRPCRRSASEARVEGGLTHHCRACKFNISHTPSTQTHIQS